jgi:hypothetical protein
MHGSADLSIHVGTIPDCASVIALASGCGGLAGVLAMLDDDDGGGPGDLAVLEHAEPTPTVTASTADKRMFVHPSKTVGHRAPATMRDLG